jgi:multidrug efflux pump subunit AcrA (membrane-fusion protein)
VRERVVEVGATHGDMVEVREGLNASDRVVARGAGFLGDGDLVRVVDEAEAGAAADDAATPASGRTAP